MILLVIVANKYKLIPKLFNIICVNYQIRLKCKPMERNKGHLLTDLAKAARWYRSDSIKQYNVEHLGLYDRLARNLTDRGGYARYLLDVLGPIQGRVLEIAGGTGIISSVISEQYPKAIISDLNEHALGYDTTENNVQGRQKSSADFMKLPFKTDTFGATICVGGYRYVPSDNAQLFWKEMSRVIKPEGLLIIGQFYPILNKLRGEDISSHAQANGNGFQFIKLPDYKARTQQNIPSGHYETYVFTKT